MKKLLIILSLYPLINIAQDLESGGGEYIMHKHNSCLSKQDRFVIWNEIKENLKYLENKNIIPKKQKSVLFGWPLRKDTLLEFNNYYGISNFVDQDTTTGILLDYNCQIRTYDGHRGTDFFTWPFPWYLYDNDYIDVIAGEDGIIVNKHDGHDDDHCLSTAGGSWNAVYVRHNDGSIVWYGHLKKNSLTSKSIGQSVTKGEYLGKVASSGVSTGPHLHLEIHDSSWNLTDPFHGLIDPFQGSCNSLNSNSWWLNQRNYRVPVLNALLTHNAKPIHGCPGINEAPNMSNSFIVGDSVFFAAYYSDRELGDSAKYKIITPSNTIWNSWNQVASTTYNASWYYWRKLLPHNGPFGLWKFEIEFKGQVYTHEFLYSGSLSIENQNKELKKLIRVSDILGRETKVINNKLLLFIYDDGTVEKKIIIQ